MKSIFKSSLIVILFAFIFQANCKSMPQYFIRILPKKELVRYGTIQSGSFMTNLVYITKDNKPIETNPAEALKWINDSIIKNKNGKVLFYIHGFWGSLPYAIHYTSKTFEEDYFKMGNSPLVAIIHIIWDASGITYEQSINSIAQSHKTLAYLLNNIDKTIDFRRSLMCHSMGNRFLHKTISNNIVSIKFDELIMMAPDLDIEKFDKDINLFSSLANKVYVFYHRKDLTLRMSKKVNNSERLGRAIRYSNQPNISFIDCTNIKDDKIIDRLNNHLYFLTSKTVIDKIETLLRN